MRKKSMNLKTEAKNFLENLKFMEKTNHQLTNTYTAPVHACSKTALWIRIQKQGNLPKLTNKPDLQPIKEASDWWLVL